MYDELVKRLRAAAIMSEALSIFLPHSEGSAVAKLYNEAADAIEKLSKPKWIPVTEQCPEKSDDYLVFDDCRDLYVNEWHCLLKKWQYDDSRITHWMPLPQPPKEE